MQSDRSKAKKNQSVTKSALLMSAGTFFSRILGYFRDAVVGAYFDRTVTDVFAAAFALPNFFRRLLGEGSLSVAFIPVYVEKISESEQGERGPRAMGLANAVYTLVMLMSLAICAGFFVGMRPFLMAWLGEEAFLSVPGKFDLAVSLSRITIFYLFLVTSYAYFMAMAQALNKFFVPALAPAFFNLFFIIIAILPTSVFPFTETQLAWAVIVGGFVQTLMVAGLLYRLGIMPRPTLNLNLPGVKLILLNMAPGILGLAASQFMNLMNQKFAAGLDEGSMTHVYYTNRLLELPQSLIAISIGTALLPTLSRLQAEKNFDEFKATCERQIRLFWFLAIPSAAGLCLLSGPIVQVLFERGRWTPEDSLVVSSLVQIISIHLIFSGTSRLLIPGFYAKKNTRIPALITTLIVGFHIILAPNLMAFMGVKGLVMSVTIAGIFGFLLTSTLHRWKVIEVRWVALLSAQLKLVPGLVAVSLVCFFLHPLLSGAFGDSFLSRFVALFSVVGLSGFVYFYVSYLLKVKEAEVVTEKLLRKLKRT